MPFDFSAYARALEAKDVEALLAFYAPGAEWVEYRPGAPPSAPARIRGHAAIAELLRGVAADPGVTLAVSHQVLGTDRIAFRITVGLPGGRRDIEHAICELRDGLIVEHAEVEAWDPEDPYGGREPTSHELRAGEPWDASYAGGPAPWDIGRPQPAIVRLADEGAFAGAVLDAGCGTGENSLHIASLGLDVLGVDVADTALSIARRNAAQRRIDAEFAVADALHLDRLDRVFETVLDCGLFHALDGEERRDYAASLAAVTRRGGRLYLLCFSDAGPETGPHPVSEEELRAAFGRSSDWAVVSISPDRCVTRFAEQGVPAWLATFERI